MNVVDSSAWIEYLVDTPNAASFAEPIQNAAELTVPTLTLFEVFKRVSLLRGEPAAIEAVVMMMRGTVVELDAGIALEAARLSLAHGLAMADSIILATARAEGATLWTQDAHFEGLDGVEYRAPQPSTA